MMNNISVFLLHCRLTRPGIADVYTTVVWADMYTVGCGYNGALVLGRRILQTLCVSVWSGWQHHGEQRVSDRKRVLPALLVTTVCVRDLQDRISLK